MNIQILFFILGLSGLFLLYFGSKLLLEVGTKKIIGALQLTETDIYFKETGLYSLCIIGGGSATNLRDFKTTIIHKDIQVESVEKNLKFKFHYNGKLATEFFQFEIVQPGIYQITILNIQDLEVKESMSLFQSASQKALPTDEIGFLIKEAVNSSTFILGLILTFVGLTLAGFGFILAFST